MSAPGPLDYPLHLIDASHGHTIALLNDWLAQRYPVMCDQYPDRTRRWHALAAELLDYIATSEDTALAAAHTCQLAAELLLRQGERIPIITPTQKEDT